MTRQVKIDKSRRISDPDEVKMWMTNIPQVYFFVLADCDGSTLDEGEQIDFDFTLNLLNDGGHFSEEEDGMILFYLTAMLIFGIVMGANIYKYIHELMKYEQAMSPMLLLQMSLTLHFGHIFL